jgi:hypothetical protein
MARGKVIVDDRFNELGDMYERGVQRALGRAAGATLAAARAGASASQYNLGPIADSIKVTETHRVPRGWRTFVYVGDFRGLWFEKGTRRRLGRLKSGRDDPGANRGVKPQRFLKNAAKVARVALLRELQRELQ